MPIPSATVTPAPSLTPILPALNLVDPTVVVIASNLPGPDDLQMALDGAVLVSDITAGVIERLDQQNTLAVLIRGLSVSEGMVYLQMARWSSSNRAITA